MTNNRQIKGFTLVELTLAMAFISFLLLFMVSAILQVTKLYVKGSSIRQINQTGRQVVEDIAASVRTGAAPTFAAGHNRLCVGNTTYAWNAEGETINRFNDPTRTTVRFVSVQDADGALCSAPYNDIPKVGSMDLIGADVTTLKFTVQPQGKLWSISLVLSTAGSNIASVDASTPTGFTCTPVNRPDNQFCAFGDFKTSVYARKGE